MEISYDTIAKLEILNEFAYGIHGRLVGFFLNNEAAKSDKFYQALLESFEIMLAADVYQFNENEIDKAMNYWQAMRQLLQQLGVIKYF